MRTSWLSAHTQSFLDVPGAQLRYEVIGDGPVLLLIPGGGADAGSYAELLPLLCESHTVLTYDPRGTGSARPCRASSRTRAPGSAVRPGNHRRSSCPAATAGSWSSPMRSPVPSSRC